MDLGVEPIQVPGLSLLSTPGTIAVCRREGDLLTGGKVMT